MILINIELYELVLVLILVTFFDVVDDSNDFIMCECVCVCPERMWDTCLRMIFLKHMLEEARLQSIIIIPLCKYYIF